MVWGQVLIAYASSPSGWGVQWSWSAVLAGLKFYWFVLHMLLAIHARDAVGNTCTTTGT